MLVQLLWWWRVSSWDDIYIEKDLLWCWRHGVRLVLCLNDLVRLYSFDEDDLMVLLRHRTIYK